jgi:hypothetical protein
MRTAFPAGALDFGLRGFTGFASGDVLGYTGQPVGFLIYIKDRESAAIDPALRSVRTDNAVIMIHKSADLRCS